MSFLNVCFLSSLFFFFFSQSTQWPDETDAYLRHLSTNVYTTQGKTSRRPQCVASKLGDVYVCLIHSLPFNWCHPWNSVSYNNNLAFQVPLQEIKNQTTKSHVTYRPSFMKLSFYLITIICSFICHFFTEACCLLQETGNMKTKLDVTYHH